MKESKTSQIRKFKDSVFSTLLKEDEYRLELYKSLCPEDKNVRPQDIELSFSETILHDSLGLFNDFCLTVREWHLVTVAVQSTFNQSSLAARFLIHGYNSGFLAKCVLHAEDTSSVRPTLEFYVVYTGDERVPEVFDISETLGWIKAKVKVLKEKDLPSDNIVHQYAQFSRLLEEKVALYPKDSHKAIAEAINECIEKNILAKFLTAKRDEVTELLKKELQE